MSNTENAQPQGDAVEGSPDRLKDLVENHPMPTFRPFAWGIMFALSAFVAWAVFANLDEVSIAMGQVVPQGSIKTVQHLEGGIIEQIYVTEGDTVQQGDPLVQLDLGSSGVNKEELEVRLDGYLIQRARLAVEASGAEEVVFDEDLVDRRPDLIQSEMQSFEARKRDLDNRLRTQNERLIQKNLAVDELNAKKTALQNNIRITRERYQMSSNLVKRGLTKKIDHLAIEAELLKLEGDLGSLIPSIPKAEAAAAEITSRLEEEESEFRSGAQEELSEIERAIAQTREVLSEADEQGTRTLITSPIDGVVKNMPYNTLGGVVRPGEPIMEIVPTGDRLVVEAKLNPIDRGYVEPGQNATVKVSTYDFVRYGGLEGQVMLVAPDSTTDPDGLTYFRVVVETDKTYLGEQEGIYAITPGMEATVDIHTGSKSVMDYLVRPVLKLKHEAFRER